jgi:hypothetical protein
MRRAYAGLLLVLLGCDPTRGLADTADAALPSVKRYFDGRGSQLVDGPWYRVVVDLDADTLYHVGGRRSDDDVPTFHLFGADARTGCEVSPNAGTWLMGKPKAAPTRLLPFLESMDDRSRGRLRFTTLDCQVQDLAIEDAGRPYARLYDHGYLVPTKHGYTFADPWAGESREIAAQLQRVLLWNDQVLLWADDELKSFSDQFEPGDEWGNTPEAIVQIRDDFLVEDADGLHHVKLDPESLAISAEPVLPDACGLQHSALITSDEQGSWVVLQQPCGNPKPTLLHLDPESFETLDATELPFEADSRQTRALVPGVNLAGDDVPLTAVYLTDLDDNGFGSLWAWQTDGTEPFKLGERASLDTASILPPGDWFGTAQVNFQRLGGVWTHDLIHFNPDGSVENVAERVVRNSSSGETLVNFDGVAGELPMFLDSGYRVLAKGIPAFSGTTSSFIGDRHYARVDQFDGTSGRALLGTEASDPSAWTAIGSNVPPDLLRFAWFMPALLFIENWDADSKTGSLVAYNYELDARDTIAEGVSSFDLTSYPWEGVVYSVPNGKKRGIWFSKAK